MVLGSWLTDAPQARRAQRLWGESQLGFQRGPWRCVLLVKLLDLSVLSFRPFIAWSQVPREDGAQRLPHASWFKASPWGGGGAGFIFWGNPSLRLSFLLSLG